MTAHETVADAAVIGRGSLCGELHDRAERGLATVLVAPAGRGKSALLAAVAESWHSRGLPVVSLTAAPADVAVPYAVVAELFATLGADCPCLEGPQKDAVRWVLRQQEGPEPELGAVRLAALSCATKLAERGRILLAADDLQWWDPGSAEVLGFLARRIGDRLAVLAAARPDAPPAAALLGREALELPVPPLTPAETAALLDGRGIPHRLAGRVHTAAGGNPRLAIEIARGLGDPADTLDPVPVTSPAARRTIRGWLAELPESVWQVLLVAAVAADPAVSTLRRAAGPTVLDTLAAAQRAGLIAVDAHGMLTFPAAAVRESLLADASEQTLRNAHRLLAAASPNPIDRLWHAASAQPGPDAAMVRGLTNAAAEARRHGERSRAAELALLAAELVPVERMESGWDAEAAEGPRATAFSGAETDQLETSQWSISAADADLRPLIGGGESPLRARISSAKPLGFALGGSRGFGTADPAADCFDLSGLDACQPSPTASFTSASEISRLITTVGIDPDRSHGPASTPAGPSVSSSDAIHAARAHPVDRPTSVAPESAESLLVDAAVDAGTAGRRDLARTALARLDSSGADHASRARARIAVVDAVGQALAGLDALLAQALADAETAGDPALLSEVHLRLAWYAHLSLGRNDRALRAARAAVRCAEQSGDAEALAGALVMMARIQQVVGATECSATLRRALALGTSPRAGGLVHRPQWTAVRFALFAYRLDEARHHLRTLTPRAERSGSSEDLRLVLRAAIEIEARAGNGALARRLTSRLLSLPGAETASPGPAWHAAALAELAGGTLAGALRYAELGAESSAQEHDQIFLIRSLHVAGMVRLLLRDAAGAADDLRRVRELEQRQGVRDPATVRYHADLAESCVALGDLDEAVEVLAEARRAAAALDRRGVLASLDRAEGIRRTALGDFARAEAFLLRAERTFGRLGLPLERARVLLAQSVLEKRQRRAARSRSTYQTAADTFARAGAELWGPRSLDSARTTVWSAPAERGGSANPGRSGSAAATADRMPPRPDHGQSADSIGTVGTVGSVGGKATAETAPRSTNTTTGAPRPVARSGDAAVPAGPGADHVEHPALTPAELRVVQLVVAGCANREVAATLFLSVKTVEAVLTGVYRKLGVRSRTQLCLLFSTDPRPPLVETG